MTKTNLKWRLGKLPTSQEVLDLINGKVITQEEARDILFNLETDDERDKKSLEAEIKFLRELVERLSDSRHKIVETIRYVQKPYYQWEWIRPYEVWCSSGTNNLVYTSAQAGTSGTITASSSALNTLTTTGTAGITNAVSNLAMQGQVSGTAGPSQFSAIKTF